MFKHLEKVAGFVIDSGSSFKSNALTISAMYVQRCHIYAQVVNYLNASPKYGFFKTHIKIAKEFIPKATGQPLIYCALLPI